MVLSFKIREMLYLSISWYYDSPDTVRAHICHKYHELYSWRKYCHVEKFGLSIKNLNNLWSFIEVYAVFVQNLCGENLCGEKMTNMRPGHLIFCYPFPSSAKASAEFFHLRFCFRIVLRNWKRTEKEFQWIKDVRAEHIISPNSP